MTKPQALFEGHYLHASSLEKIESLYPGSSVEKLLEIKESLTPNLRGNLEFAYDHFKQNPELSDIDVESDDIETLLAFGLSAMEYNPLTRYPIISKASITKISELEKRLKNNTLHKVRGIGKTAIRHIRRSLDNWHDFQNRTGAYSGLPTPVPVKAGNPIESITAETAEIVLETLTLIYEKLLDDNDSIIGAAKDFLFKVLANESDTNKAIEICRLLKCISVSLDLRFRFIEDEDDPHAVILNNYELKAHRKIRELLNEE